MEKNEHPLVSVIMGIYNCADTLTEAINCIIHQTYSNWELIMCDDGSTDTTYLIADSIKNKYCDRIVLLQNDSNKGLNYTLNRCLKECKGNYIARMDADDVCDPERFAIEVEWLEKNRDYAIVSTDMLFFDETGDWGMIQHPDFPKKIDFVKESPFCHAPCMVRKEAFDAVSGYTVDSKLLRVEDYHLWIKMYSAGYKGANIHLPLYKMRDDRNAYSRRSFQSRKNEAYVKRLAVNKLHLPYWMMIYSLRPIITGLMPEFIYKQLHKKRLSNSGD